MKATHKVSFYGVRCYLNDKTGDLWGVNRLCDWLIHVAVWLHVVTASIFTDADEEGFPLRVLEEYE